MAQEVVLVAESRDGSGRSASQKVRAAGRLPAIIYGTGIEPRSLSVDRHEFLRALHAHGMRPLVTLKIGGDEYLALVKEVQIDARHHEAIHIDFLRVRADVPVNSEVLLVLVGEPKGVKLSGGVLETHLRTVLVAALPRQIPETIEVDVSAMDIGDALRVDEVVAPPGAEILTDVGELVATVSMTRAAAAGEVEEAAAAAAEEGAEEGSAEGEGKDES